MNSSNYNTEIEIDIDLFLNVIKSLILCAYNASILFKHIYVVYSISFQTFFVQAFKIVIDSWKFSILYNL